jgi:hypothetical protein
MSVEINNLFVYQNNPFDGQNVYSTNIRITIDSLSVFTVCNHNLEYAASYQWAKSNDLQNFSQALKAIKERDAFLKNNPDNLHLLLEDEAYTLVPQSLFVEAELNSYLTHFVEPDKLKSGTAISCEVNQIVVVSLLNNALADAAKSVFLNAEVKSYTTALLSFSNTVRPKIRDYSLMVSMNSSYFDLVIKKRGQLHFFNRFAFSSKEDFVYFLILTLQNLEIKNTDVEIALLGEINPQSSITEMLNRYFSEVGFVKSDQEFSWDYHRYCVEQNY